MAGAKWAEGPAPDDQRDTPLVLSFSEGLGSAFGSRACLLLFGSVNGTIVSGVIACFALVLQYGEMKILLLLTLAAFSVLTGLALWSHGVMGILNPLLTSLAGGQVLADLVIALSLFLIWVWGDAKRLNRNPWPWLILTVAAGSFGPLIYLLTRNSEESL